MPKPRLAERQQFSFVGASPLPQDHKGDHFLAEISIGYTYSRRFQHRRMRFQNLVDLARGNVDAALDDQFLGAAHDKEVSIFVLVGQVSGVQPSLGVQYRGSPLRSL